MTARRGRRLHPHRGGFRVNRFATLAVCTVAVYVAVLAVLIWATMPAT